MQRTCSIEGCEEAHMARDWCRLHYFRWRRTGDPGGPQAAPYGSDRPTRTCTSCGAEKPSGEFGTRSGGRWYKSWCRPCESAKAKERNAKRTPVQRTAGAEVYWRRMLVRNYGITHLDYERMFTEQDGRCGICGTTEPGGSRERFSVDHCHATGIVRGLLCSQCNTAIGLLGDTAEGIRRALAYLERS